MPKPNPLLSVVNTPNLPYLSVINSRSWRFVKKSTQWSYSAKGMYNCRPQLNRANGGIIKVRVCDDQAKQADAKIIALEAKIHKLTNGGKSKRKGDKDSKDGKKKKQKKEKPKWMYQRPKDEDLKKPREWNGIKWWYCSPDTGGKCQGVYRVHKPSECKSLKPKGESGPKKGTGGDDDKVAVTVSQATIDPALSDVNMEDGNEIMGGYETG